MSSSGGGVQDNVTYLDLNPTIARSCGGPGTAKKYPSVKIYTVKFNHLCETYVPSSSVVTSAKRLNGPPPTVTADTLQL